MADNWYDTAQICINGHMVNLCSISMREHNKKFCDKCGAPTITNCPNCNTRIRGYYHSLGNPADPTFLTPLMILYEMHLRQRLQQLNLNDLLLRLEKLQRSN